MPDVTFNGAEVFTSDESPVVESCGSSDVASMEPKFSLRMNRDQEAMFVTVVTPSMGPKFSLWMNRLAFRCVGKGLCFNGAEVFTSDESYNHKSSFLLILASMEPKFSLRMNLSPQNIKRKQSLQTAFSSIPARTASRRAIAGVCLHRIPWVSGTLPLREPCLILSLISGSRGKKRRLHACGYFFLL